MFLEVIVLSLMNIRHPKFNRLDQTFSFLVALVFFLMFMALLIWSFCYPYKKYDKLRMRGKFDDPRFMSMFGEYKMRNPTQIFFNSIFMVRRLLYGFIIIFLIDFPLVQAFLFTMIWIPVFCIHVVSNPFKDTKVNVLMNLNETSFIVIGCCFFTFSKAPGNMEESKSNDKLGWLILGIVVLVILLNLIALWIFRVFTILKALIEYCKEKSKKKSRRTRFTEVTPFETTMRRNL